MLILKIITLWTLIACAAGIVIAPVLSRRLSR
jgi:hypothetical protein